MNEYIITRFNPYDMYNKIEHKKIRSNDMLSAINMSGFSISEIVSVKLNMNPPSDL